VLSVAGNVGVGNARNVDVAVFRVSSDHANKAAHFPASCKCEGEPNQTFQAPIGCTGWTKLAHAFDGTPYFTLSFSAVVSIQYCTGKV